MEPSILIERWSYLGIFFLTFLGNVGIPVPEEIIFISTGYLAANGYISLLGAMLFSIFAVSATNNMSYFAGRWFGKPIFKFLKKVKGIHHVIEIAEHLFKKHGEKTLFFSRFVWNVRNITPLIAGATGMKWKKYMTYDFLAIIIHIPILVLLGFFFSSAVNRIFGLIEEGKIFILILFLLFVGILLSKKIYKTIEKRFF
ncbi:MAG: DedA family protein [Candidatus Pacearchaeota archaeon]|nr:DedA family protein [Candidatus Pacearchaeota archaeon]